MANRLSHPYDGFIGARAPVFCYRGLDGGTGRGVDGPVSEEDQSMDRTRDPCQQIERRGENVVKDQTWRYSEDPAEM